MIAVAFGGFDAGELGRRLSTAGKPNRMLNAATVERVLGEMRKETT
jgi:hypothetical protein